MHQIVQNSIEKMQCLEILLGRPPAGRIFFVMRKTAPCGFFLNCHFFLQSNASASNLGWFPENFCQTRKHDRILMFTDWTALYGDSVVQKHLPPDQASLCVEFSNIIHESMVVATPVDSFIVPDSYRIGFGHNAETCDSKQSILSILHNEGITPDVYSPMIDDITMTIDCIDIEVERKEHLFQTIDPCRL